MDPPVGIETPTGGCPLSWRVPKIHLCSCTSHQNGFGVSWSLLQVHTRVQTKSLNQVATSLQCHWRCENVNWWATSHLIDRSSKFKGMSYKNQNLFRSMIIQPWRNSVGNQEETTGLLLGFWSRLAIIMVRFRLSLDFAVPHSNYWLTMFKNVKTDNVMKNPSTGSLGLLPVCFAILFLTFLTFSHVLYFPSHAFFVPNSRTHELGQCGNNGHASIDI